MLCHKGEGILIHYDANSFDGVTFIKINKCIMVFDVQFGDLVQRAQY